MTTISTIFYGLLLSAAFGMVMVQPGTVTTILPGTQGAHCDHSGNTADQQAAINVQELEILITQAMPIPSGTNFTGIDWITGKTLPIKAFGRNPVNTTPSATGPVAVYSLDYQAYRQISRAVISSDPYRPEFVPAQRHYGHDPHLRLG